MNKQIFQGKTKEEAILLAEETLNAKEDELVIIEKDAKKSLFSKKVEIVAITKYELNNEIKKYLLKIIKDMGIDVQIEVKIREQVPYFNIIAPDISILIGKNGRTIDALQILTSQMINSNLNTYYKFIIDVNDYDLIAEFI